MEIESGDKSLSNEYIYNVSLWSSSSSRTGFFFFNLFLIVTNVNLNTILVTVKKKIYLIKFYCD